MTAFTAYTSSLRRMDVRVYQADRDNVIGREISDDLVTCIIDADRERTDGKMRIELGSFNRDDIAPNMWVAPFITITPSTGDIVTRQYGLFRLDVPTTVIAPDGDAYSNEGVDVIGTFRGALPEEMVTPASILLMDEISYTMERASLKYCGPNLLPNGDFEPTPGVGSTAGWSFTQWPSSSSGLVVVESSDEAATNVFPLLSHGSYGYRFRAPTASVSVGAGATISTPTDSRLPIPANMSEVYIESLVWFNTDELAARTFIRFYDAAGVEIVDGYLESGGDLGNLRRPPEPNMWIRMVAFGAVPENAQTCRVAIRLERVDPKPGVPGFGGANVEAVVDFIAMRRAIGPMFTRHRLPRAEDSAKTRESIAHPAQTLWQDRLADLVAVDAYYPPFNDYQGMTTTKPVQDMPNETPVATFVIGEDSRIVEGVEIRPSRGNFYNTVTLVSEDYVNGITLTSNVVNDDPGNPWSVNQIGEYAPQTPRMVTAVMNQASLDRLARDELARASMQQSVEIAILPDPAIFIHDIIQIEGHVSAAGKWRVETVEIDASPDGDGLMHIGARRSISWGFGV